MELSTAMNRLLIAGIVIVSTAPLYAQRQQHNVAKLKADAQKVVSVISDDKAKTQSCPHYRLSSYPHRRPNAGRRVRGGLNPHPPRNFPRHPVQAGPKPWPELF